MKLSNVYVTAHAVQKNLPPLIKCPIVKPETTTTAPHKVEANFDTSLKIESHNGSIDIYFGSNTGTCENYSHRLSNNSKNLGFNTTVRPLDDLASKGFKKDRLNLIVTSTYNGQPPDNAKKFAEYCKQLDYDSLSEIKVAIIGIGNSNWKSFQAFPTYIENELCSAGAEILCKRGVADEEADMQGDVRSWVDSEFWPCVFKLVGLDPNTKRAARTEMDFNKGRFAVIDSTEMGRDDFRSPDNELVTVVSTRELQSPDSGRSTQHIEFCLPKAMDYETGDHLAVFPENDPQLVLRFGSLIREHDLGRVVVVNTQNKNAGVAESTSHLPLGIPTKVSDLLGKHLDLQAPVTPSFLSAAAAGATDPKQREVLEGMLNSASNGGEYQHLRPVQILTAFSSVNMTLDQVLSTIASMKKRYYSISSSPLYSKEARTVSITVGLVEGMFTLPASGTSNETIEQQPMPPEAYRGVSSGYLADLRPGQLAEVSVVKNERFRLPKCPRTPVIMIGPGTGVAPFRGFLQELNTQQEQHRREAMLFFGCRNKKDYLYRSELESSSSVELHVAFSRPIASDNSQYVQDLMWECRDRVWELMEKGACIYVCGDGRHMAKDVDKALCQIAMAASNSTMNETEAVAFLEELQKNGKYLQDVWCN